MREGKGVLPNSLTWFSPKVTPFLLVGGSSSSKVGLKSSSPTFPITPFAAPSQLLVLEGLDGCFSIERRLEEDNGLILSSTAGGVWSARTGKISDDVDNFDLSSNFDLESLLCRRDFILCRLRKYQSVPTRARMRNVPKMPIAIVNVVDKGEGRGFDGVSADVEVEGRVGFATAASIGVYGTGSKETPDVG